MILSQYHNRSLYTYSVLKKNQSLLPIFGRKEIRTCSKIWWINMKREDTGRPVLLSASINSCYAALTCICLSCMLKLIVTKTCAGRVTPPCPGRCYGEVNAFWGFWSIDDDDNIIIIRAYRSIRRTHISVESQITIFNCSHHRLLTSKCVCTRNLWVYIYVKYVNVIIAQIYWVFKEGHDKSRKVSQTDNIFERVVNL